MSQPHAVRCIKENIHLKVDLEIILGGETEGCLLVQKGLEGDVVASEARMVRQCSKATPKGGPEKWVQNETTTGISL